MTRRALVLALALGAVTLIFALSFGRWWIRDRTQLGSDLLPLPISEMSFKLTTHRGATVEPADWIGRPTVVFFGFTWCPDFCPTTLSEISNWLLDLGGDADRVNIVFVSVDPERDTPNALAEYLLNFDPRIVGLTGPMDEIERAAAGLRARFEKVPQDGGYSMDHTSGVFLFRSDGRFTAMIDLHESRDSVLSKIRRIFD